MDNLIESADCSTAQSLLDNDDFGSVVAYSEVQKTAGALADIVSAVSLLSSLREYLFKRSNKPRVAWSEVYVLALSNDLTNSSLLEDSLAVLKKLDSETLATGLLQVLDSQPGHHDALRAVSEKLRRFTDGIPKDKLPIKSSHGLQHANLRATVVAQKVELSRQASRISFEEAAYTNLVDEVVSTVSEIFDRSFVDPRSLFLHEAFIYDGRLQHREAFMPRPRFVIERALSSPHDYLGCDCCGGDGDAAGNHVGGLSPSQPAIAIVYQLYLESGSVINTADLWSAFWSIFRPRDQTNESEEGEEGEEREKELAL